ncbi:MAG: hypothetical protein NTV51_08820 [Verrucomicrobia bacterium]|nr:hypothetical protein [Verrucomicrobiota bacterium]
MPLRPLHTALLSSLLAGLASPAVALDVFNYSPTVNERFDSGFATSPVANASGSFIGAGFDFSGVGWQTAASAFSVTMITAQNFVTARHAAPAPGSTVTFFSQDGVLRTYTVGSVSTISYNGASADPSDLVVGTLTAAIPASDHIAAYPILFNGTAPSAIDLAGYSAPTMLVYGQGGRIGSNTIDGFVNGDLYPLGNPNGVADSLYFHMDFDPITGQAQGQGGDSGSPTFSTVGGSLSLVGVHSAIGTIGSDAATFDNFLAWPTILAQINDVAAASGQTVGLTVTAIPEPATTAALAGVFALGAVCWRRRRADSK